MEEKGILLTEGSCRTAPELPPQDCPPKLRQSGRRRSRPAAAEACTPGAELPPKLAGPARGARDSVPLPQFFLTMAEISPTTSLYLL